MRLASLIFPVLVAVPAPVRAEAGAVVRVDTKFQSVPVRPGDTLWGIARAYLQDPAKWDEILKYNRLPTSDPTIALPGMTLRVPVRLIKTSLRAAHLTFVVNEVLARRKDTAEWKPGGVGAELYRGDTLRTLDDSKARVMFLDKDLLNLDPNSMAVIKPEDRADADVVLRAGSVFAGHARVATAAARVTPKTGDTRYSARVDADLTTRVEVFSGLAAVSAQGRSVNVKAGMGTRVPAGLAPEPPRPVEDVPDLEARAQEFLSAGLNGGGAAPDPRPVPPAPAPEADAERPIRREVQVIRVLQPTRGFHVQASRTQDFTKVVFDRTYDADERFAASETGLAPGAYWWRVSALDLLGVEGKFHAPHYYTVGVKEEDLPQNARLAEMVEIASPEDNAEVGSESVRVVGLVRDARLVVEVAGVAVKPDDDGNFAIVVHLKVGSNTIGVSIKDKAGNQSYVSRHVTRL